VDEAVSEIRLGGKTRSVPWDCGARDVAVAGLACLESFHHQVIQVIHNKRSQPLLVASLTGVGCELSLNLLRNELMTCACCFCLLPDSPGLQKRPLTLSTPYLHRSTYHAKLDH
jgi:hypothetical protein